MGQVIVHPEALDFMWLPESFQKGGSPLRVGVRMGELTFDSDAATETVTDSPTILVYVQEGSLSIEITSIGGSVELSRYVPNAGRTSATLATGTTTALHVNDRLMIDNATHRLFTGAGETARISVSTIQAEEEDIRPTGCRPCPTYPL